MQTVEVEVADRPITYDTSPEPCPCCGHTPEVGATKFGFDYFKGRVFKQGVRVLLSPKQADLLKILLDAWPTVASRREILIGLYGGAYQMKVGRGRRVIVHLSKLRKKLRPLGLDVCNAPNKGWWLTRRGEVDIISP